MMQFVDGLNRRDMKPAPNPITQLPNGQAMLAVNDREQQIVSIGWKETYDIAEDGFCGLAEEQAPFEDPTEERPEPEFFPYKSATDLVVQGAAHAPGERSVPEMIAAVLVGRMRKEIKVIGDRTCTYQHGQAPKFSEPEPFTTMPLGYERAYGGKDPSPREKTLEELLAVHPGTYPRNDTGRGYVLANEPDSMEGLALPNLENPRDRLTPNRLVVGDSSNWWKQPLPESFDWTRPHWYPRMVHLGLAPEGLPSDERLISEVKKGYLPVGHQRLCANPFTDPHFSLRFTNGAAWDLIFPYLRADEQIKLKGMRPQGDWLVQLPGTAPEMLVRFRGASSRVLPVLHTVLIQTDEARLTLVWRGAWSPPVKLPTKLPTIQNPDFDPLEGVAIWINGQTLR